MECKINNVERKISQYMKVVLECQIYVIIIQWAALSDIDKRNEMLGQYEYEEIKWSLICLCLIQCN